MQVTPSPDSAKSRRLVTISIVISVMAIATVTIAVGANARPSVQSLFASVSTSKRDTFGAKLKRLESFSHDTEKTNGPLGSTTQIEIGDDELKKYCYGEFEGMKNQRELAAQLYSEMKVGASPNPSGWTLTYRTSMNLVGTDATSMTDFRQSAIFGGASGTPFEWVPMETFVNVFKGSNSAHIDGIKFEAGTKPDYIYSPKWGSGGTNTGFSRVYGCIADFQIWSGQYVNGMRVKFCRAPPLGYAISSGVYGHQTGTSAWAFGTGCSQCGSSATSRRCIVGVRGRAASLVDQISFVQACTDLW